MKKWQAGSHNRFVKLSKADVKSFSKEQENANTSYDFKMLILQNADFKLFKEFVGDEEEMRKIFQFLG